MRRSRWPGLLAILLALALLGWVLSSIRGIFDRLATVSPTLAAVLVGILLFVLFVVLGYGLHFLWTAGRVRDRDDAPTVPADPTAAAAESLEAARKQVEQVTDEVARRALSREMEALSGDLVERRYTIVVFGTGSAGKTAVINALLGTHAGLTDAIVGTTRDGAEHDYTIEGFADGKLRLIDTPGLSEIGPDGLMREERARELATGADLLLFVVDQDLREIEFRPLASLARLGKRSVLVFNKRDLYAPEEAEQITARLRERAARIDADVEVLGCAAAPAPVEVRAAGAEQSAPRVQPLPPDVTDLADRIAAILRAEGRDLLARNVLLRAASVSDRARDLIHQARRDEARRVAARYQWITAGVMFVNPIPGLGALAAAAINYQMVMEIAKVFGVSLSVESARKLAGELAQVLVKMGVVGLAADLLAKALKASVVGYVAGGTIEAMTGAYLSRLAGETFIDYFARNQSWGDGGMQAAIERQFALLGQRQFIADFIKEATQRVIQPAKRSAGRQTDPRRAAGPA